MKNKFGQSYLLSLFVVGSLLTATQLEAQSPTDLGNMARLVGNWRRVPREGWPSDDAHYAFSLNGNNVVVISVQDKDDVERDILKGDKRSFGSFRLNGRRLNGVVKMWGRHGDVPLAGIVSEDFKQIDWRYPLPGVSNGSGGQHYVDATLLRE